MNKKFNDMRSGMREIKEVLNLFDKKFKLRLMAFVLIQFVFSILDLVGILLVGVVGTFTLRGLKSQDVGKNSQFVIDFFHLDNLPYEKQVGVISILAVTFLITKSIAFLIFNKLTIQILAQKSAELTIELTEKITLIKVEDVRTYTTQQFIFALVSGIPSILLGLLSPLVNLCVDFLSIVVLVTGLFIVDPVTSIILSSFFTILAIILYMKLAIKAKDLGRRFANLSVLSNENMIELIELFREIRASGLSNDYLDINKIVRKEIANVDAKLRFLPNLSKYVMEMAVIVLASIVTTITVVRLDIYRGVGVLTLVLAASTRLAPAILRLQQNGLLIRASLSITRNTLDIMNYLEARTKESEITNKKLSRNRRNDLLNNGLSIHFDRVSFKYKSNLKNVLNDLNFSIATGKVLLIIGPSGAGKSTIVDLMLGLLSPSEGNIYFNNLLPVDFISNNKSCIGYVSQKHFFSNKSIKESIGLLNEYTDEKYWDVLSDVNLSDFVKDLPGQLQYFVGENANSLSGGQKQRLAIARALIMNPKILILDEATSALDSQNTSIIREMINKRKGELITIIISHDMGALDFADYVLEISNGKQVFFGEKSQYK